MKKEIRLVMLIRDLGIKEQKTKDQKRIEKKEEKEKNDWWFMIYDLVASNLLSSQVHIKHLIIQAKFACLHQLSYIPNICKCVTWWKMR